MSALTFLLRTDGAPSSEKQASQVLDRMAERGPDGRAVWTSGPAAFGHGLLVNTPESCFERYPIAGSDGRFQILWDGRLDNRDALLAALSASGRSLPPDSTDPAIVLAMFEIWRVDTPAKLEGDFCFVVWDSIARIAFCARDPVGARPCYFASLPHSFALASEDEALLAMPGLSPDPSVERIAARLLESCRRALDPRQSWIKDVFILQPGMSLTVDDKGKVDEKPYWCWRAPSVAQFESDAEALEAFESVWLSAVRARTRGLDRLGIITSGGLDSASIALAASRIADGRDMECFSFLSEESEDCVETRAIQSLVRAVGATPRFTRVPSLTGEIGLEDLTQFHRRPHPIDSVIPLIGLACCAAARRGHRVLLHGATGDVALWETDDYLLRVLRERGMRAAWLEARAAQSHHTYAQGRSLASMWWASFRRDGVPADLRAWLAKVLRTLRMLRRARPLPAQTTLEVLEDIALQLAQPSFRAPELDLRHAAPSQREHMRALFPSEIANGLEGYERVAGRYGIELRDPWSDRRVIEFCVALPTSLKTSGGWTKSIGRRWCGRHLPDECVWRSDRTHLGHWLHHSMTHPGGDARQLKGDAQLSAARTALDSCMAEPDDPDRAWMAGVVLAWWSNLSRIPHA